MLPRRPHERPPAAPRRADVTFFLHMLVLYGALVVVLQLNIPRRVLANARRERARPPPPELAGAPARGAPHAARAPRAARGGLACVARLALYYAPRSTQPRLEDFEFLTHAVRVWQATDHTACLVILTDLPSHNPLSRACRALPQCRELGARSGLPPNATLERFVQAAVQRDSCPPSAGVVVRAPAQGQPGAALDSRALFSRPSANASTCIDVLVAPHPCMAYAFTGQPDVAP